MNRFTAIVLRLVFASCPSATQLGHGLAALSVACRLCGQEVAALNDDETTADEFLAARGWSS